MDEGKKEQARQSRACYVQGEQHIFSSRDGVESKLLTSLHGRIMCPSRRTKRGASRRFVVFVIVSRRRRQGLMLCGVASSEWAISSHIFLLQTSDTIQI